MIHSLEDFLSLTSRPQKYENIGCQLNHMKLCYPSFRYDEKDDDKTNLPDF